MARRILALQSALLAILASNAKAQTNDGYVGIYRDAAGLLPCATVPQQSGTTLYVIAKTAGASANGITGAEFRIEVTNPTGWFFSYTAPATASLVLGNVLDTSSDPNDTSGLNVSFASCVTPAGGNIALGTITVYNASGSATNMLVKQHNEPSNAGYQCPLFTVCDAPTYTKSCMTPSTEQPCSLGKTGPEHRPSAGAVFTATLNVSDPSESVDLGTPERQVLAMFANGVIAMPVGQNAATFQNTVITSSGVTSVLQANGVEAIAKAFPDVPAKAGQFGEDGIIQSADLSEIYRLVLPASGNAAQLEAALQGVAGVVYAHRNGGAALGDITIVQSKSDHGIAGGGGSLEIDAPCTYSPPLALCTYTVLDCPNDPLFSSQWAHVNVGQDVGGVRGNCDADIDLDEAWGIQKGAIGSTVAVIGGGVWRSHPDLAGRVSGDEGGSNWSTLEAGVIAANNNNAEGIVGMDWQAKVVSKRIDQTDDVGICQALHGAVSLGAVVFNNSWYLWDGPPTFNSRFSPTVRIAFRDLYMDNRVMVTMMGSTSTPGGLQYPAAFGQGIIAVGASTQIDERLSTSNSGSHIDVVAPGDKIRCTSQMFGPYALAIGTAIAAPHAAGLASLLLAEKSHLANDDIEQIIRITAADIFPTGWDVDTGTGRINANAALALVQLPNRLYHLTASGSSTTIGLGADFRLFVVSPAPGFNPGYYYTEKIEVRKSVTFSIPFQNSPYVWGRGKGTVGYNQDAAQYAIGFCEAVPGTVTPTGCTLRTFVYRYTEVSGGSTLGWFPVQPSSVQFAYTALGQLRPTDAGDEDEVAASGVRFSVENPLRREGALFVSLPHDMVTALRIYNVAGAHVATLQQGELGAGRHEIRWSGRNNLGGPLPSGMYLAKLETPLRTITRKLLMLQ